VGSVTQLTPTIVVRNAFNANRVAAKRNTARRLPFRQLAFCRQTASSIQEVNLLIRTIIRIGGDPVVVFEEGENEFVLEIIRQDRPQASGL
jgi:hypothetical protein